MGSRWPRWRVSGITQLSHATPCIATHDDDADTAAESDGVSIPAAGDVNLKSLTRQLERLDVALRAGLRGSLQISVLSPYDVLYCAAVTWEGITGDEYMLQRPDEREYVESRHPSWCTHPPPVLFPRSSLTGGLVALMREADRRIGEQVTFSTHDSEASRKFERRFPGTRTVEGYAASSASGRTAKTPPSASVWPGPPAPRCPPHTIPVWSFEPVLSVTCVRYEQNARTERQAGVEKGRTRNISSVPCWGGWMGEKIKPELTAREARRGRQVSENVRRKRRTNRPRPNYRNTYDEENTVLSLRSPETPRPLTPMYGTAR